MEGLNKDGNLIGRARSKFISEVAASILFYKNYPTFMEYNHVAVEIIKKYPKLKFGQGNGHVSNFIIGT